MSPERFTDALNYLDDDLIQQTDELRQGRRVLHRGPTVRQMIRWTAPAACLVLLLGVATMFRSYSTTGDSAEAGIEFQDQIVNGSEQEYQLPTTSPCESATRSDSLTNWQTVSCGGISLQMPANWEYELESGEDDSLFIVIRPYNEEGAIKVGYLPSFGVCGTGLTTEETTIAGMRASVGTYDNSHVWTFITFPDKDEWHVVLNEGADQWWGVYGETAMEILETIVFEEKE